MKLILLGLPGAGKGTVGKQLATLLSVPHISIGDRVRELAQGDSPIGNKLRKAFSESSGWAPLADDLTVEITKASVEGLSSWILDGFPRNTVQAENAAWLNKPDAVVLLVVSEELARSRVLERGREGDAEEKFNLRMVAERERQPSLVSALSSLIPLIEVDANQSEEKVLASVFLALKERGIA